MKARKIRIAGMAAIVMVLLAALIALSIVQSNRIADVKKPHLDSVTATGIRMSWSKVSSADGYIVYAKGQNDSKFKSVAVVRGKSSNKADVKNLEQACKYDVYVTAYKAKKDSNVESKSHETFSFCTLPQRQTINLSSPDAGVMLMNWSKNANASGYELQYTKGSDFDSAKSLEFDDNAITSKKIKKLNPKSEYSVRARSYLMIDGEKLYGDWSKIRKVSISEKVVMNHNIDVNKPMIALTFDDGPGYNKASDKIVSVLEKYKARATFFMVGINASDHAENVKRKVELGCQIGNHTYDHNHYGEAVTADDIRRASEAIYNTCGEYPTAFRSTGGNTTKIIRSECKKEKMPLYYWTLDTQDWKYRDAKHVYNAVIDNVSDGDIILMHEIYDSTAEAVEKMVPELIKRGYQLVTCDELVAAKSGKKPQPGTQYMSATKIKNETH